MSTNIQGNDEVTWEDNHSPTISIREKKEYTIFSIIEKCPKIIFLRRY